ncbi:MAG TPA: guanylate kinase [Saprospiraceae bacterium]|nr:guanylate kinase [Saprospiraceae bacterium]
MSKLIVLTAPSGAGKTTIVRHLLKSIPQLSFSTSATTRYQRPGEINGKDYYFLSASDFEQKITENAFVEWEEVYQGQFYGTLKTEIERLWAKNQHIIFDIDVKGAMNIKASYPEQTLTIFVKAPSLDTLFNRLRSRRTESDEQLQKRMDKAKEEATYEERFDYVLVNDDLSTALQEAEQVVSDFIKNN